MRLLDSLDAVADITTIITEAAVAAAAGILAVAGTLAVVVVHAVSKNKKIPTSFRGSVLTKMKFLVWNIFA